MLGNRGEHVFLDSRRHGIVLAPALARAFLIAAVGGFLFSVGSVFPIAGAGLVMAAALTFIGLQMRLRRKRKQYSATLLAR